MFDRCNFDFIFFRSELSSYLGSQVGFISMLLFALSVSPHCVSMCGPLILSQMTHEKLSTKNLIKSWSIIFYQLGRFISYTLAGVSLAWLSLNIDQQIQTRLSTHKNLFAMILGGILCVMGIERLLQKTFLKNWAGTDSMKSRYFKFHFKIFSKLHTLSNRNLRMFCLGLITVGLPCMTLSPVLLGAAATQNPGSAFLILSAFFFGTLPMTSFIALFSKIFHQYMQWITWSSGILMVLAGVSIIMKAI